MLCREVKQRWFGFQQDEMLKIDIMLSNFFLLQFKMKDNYNKSVNNTMNSSSGIIEESTVCSLAGYICMRSLSAMLQMWPHHLGIYQVEFHETLFLVHSFSSYMSTTCLRQLTETYFDMQMTPVLYSEIMTSMKLKRN